MSNRAEESRAQTAKEIVEEFEAIEERLVLRETVPAAPASAAPVYAGYCEECGAGIYRADWRWCQACYAKAMTGQLASQIARRKPRNEHP